MRSVGARSPAECLGRSTAAGAVRPTSRSRRTETAVTSELDDVVTEELSMSSLCSENPGVDEPLSSSSTRLSRDDDLFFNVDQITACL